MVRQHDVGQSKPTDESACVQSVIDRKTEKSGMLSQQAKLKHVLCPVRVDSMESA